MPELRKAISAHGVLPRAVSIEGVDEKEEQYRLEKDGKYSIIYSTYYYERGEKISLREFATEDEACDYFLQWVLSDPTTRTPFARIEPKA
jgi:hypothetical protein